MQDGLDDDDDEGGNDDDDTLSDWNLRECGHFLFVKISNDWK